MYVKKNEVWSVFTSLSPHHACIECVLQEHVHLRKKKTSCSEAALEHRAANYGGQETIWGTLKPIGTGGCMHAHLFSSRRMVTGSWICTRAARATRVDNQETMAGGGDSNRAPNHGGILSAISDVGQTGFFLQTEHHLNECSLHE